MLTRWLIRLALLACAVAFSLVPAASQGAPADYGLYSFFASTAGGWLFAGPIHGPDGTLYGIASQGGGSGAGVVFASTA
jgi:uncharacterized repeat protein (TIGR03803 family)